MIHISSEESIAVLARSYRREVRQVTYLADWLHIQMPELRIGFREYDDLQGCMSLEEVNFEIHGDRS